MLNCKLLRTIRQSRWSADEDAWYPGPSRGGGFGGMEDMWSVFRFLPPCIYYVVRVKMFFNELSDGNISVLMRPGSSVIMSVS